MAYYKEIGGKKYDGELIDLADKLTKGAGDGRISNDDAKLLFAKVKDGATYSDIEKDTVELLRKNYKWTDSADEWFRSEIRSWAAKK